MWRPGRRRRFTENSVTSLAADHSIRQNSHGNDLPNSQTGDRVSNEGSEYAAAAAAGLWIPPNSWGWKTGGRDVVAQILIDGAAEDRDCRLAIVLPRRAFPSGSFSVLWNARRVRGLDLDGPAHIDPRSGRSIATPHFQQIDDREIEGIETVDLLSHDVRTLKVAFEWFMQRCGIEYQSAWLEPPLPAELLNKPARYRELRRRRPRKR
jgi:hypothetical protein